MFYDDTAFAFCAAISPHFDAIVGEFDRIRDEDLLPWLEPTKNPDGGWRSVLFFADTADESVLERAAIGRRLAPVSTELMCTVPGCLLAGFSVLGPHSEIKPHEGVYRHHVRAHLCLHATPPDTCWFECGGERRTWKEREWLVFEDRLLHRAVNRGPGTRVVLLGDFHTDFYPLPTSE